MTEMHDHKTDEEIASLVQNGDAEIFRVILERYQKKIMRYANKFLYLYEDRQDAVQDVFLKAYENIKSFDLSRSFSPWIYRIAHNTFINFIKKKGREPISFFDPDTIFAIGIPDEQEIKSRENELLKSELDEMLEKIPLKYREVLILYYYEDKNYDEIAEILEIPKNTVGVRLGRARKQIQKLYKNE